MQKLSDDQIKKTYNLIKDYHEKYLKSDGVKLPKLKSGDNYSKGALTLVCLAQGYPNTKIVSKDELTKFIRLYYKNTPDVQQGRHLGKQNGFHILSGRRNDMSSKNIQSGEYQLITLEEPYPGFSRERRIYEAGDFEEIKSIYNFRCATCGSKENEANFHWPSIRTTLQKGHMNPNKPLTLDNIIPQCSECNRADQNYWIYDKTGRVIALANPNVIKRSSKEVQRKVYDILKKEIKD